MRKWIIGGALVAGLLLWYYQRTPAPPEIRIATFNIQAFGESKRQKKDVMDVLTKTIREFDLVAIQEIRDNTETTLPYFLQKINELPGDKYAGIVGPRLGRTMSKEQYAFLYNTVKVHYKMSYTYYDKRDVFEREPFIAQFSCNRFDFTLVTIHTKPTDASREIHGLVDVVNDTLRHLTDDKDIIVVGDFNADGTYFSETTTTGLREPRFFWAVTDDMDTTVAQSSNTYDRIVFQQHYTAEDFTGRVGVFTDGLSKQVSDHYPVWAIFYTDRDTD
ncbi:endonuclease/exonuclease/phosphatase family protein [Candidatus Woesearchaeota archaeon]|nr:endonuclease/exonuclease/phosphatase family protein [Candidatus Woesearchaeota archaeon]